MLSILSIVAYKKNIKENGNKELDSALANEIILKAKIVSLNPLKLESPYLVEKTAVIKGTNIQTYGYVLKETGTIPRNVAPADPCWKIESGWFFYGRCAVYGTMFTDCSGNQAFAPCGFNCVGFHDICPPDEDDWMAQSPDKRITTVELKFSK